MASWFYTDALASQQGPVDEATLLGLNRSGELRARTLVWREGLPAWVPFRDVAAELLAQPGDGAGPVEIGVCAHSGRVHRLEEMLPYGEAFIGPEEKEDFVRRMMEGAAVGIEDATEKRFDYVGFWWRALASTVDYMVKMIPASLCMVPYYIADVLDGVKPGENANSFSGVTGWTVWTAVAYGLGVIVNLGLSIGYDTWMVGRYQATLGKLVIGAKVVNPDGTALTYRRAFLRWLVKKPLITVLVWAPAMVGFALMIGLVVGLAQSGSDESAAVVLAVIGGIVAFFALLALGTGVYWMAAFDPQKRALHDRIAGTRVVKK